MDCQTVIESLMALDLDLLDRREKVQVGVHLRSCPSCRLHRARLMECVNLLRVPVKSPEGVFEMSGKSMEREAKFVLPRPVIHSDLEVNVKTECSYCKAEVDERESVHCASCLARYHEDCFKEHGTCGIIGCRSDRFLRPVAAAVMAPPASLRRRRSSLFVGWVGAGLFASLVLGAVVIAVNARKNRALKVAKAKVATAKDALKAAALAKANEDSKAQKLVYRREEYDNTLRGLSLPGIWKLGREAQVGDVVTLKVTTAGQSVETKCSLVGKDSSTWILRTNWGVADMAAKFPEFPEVTRDYFELKVDRNGRVRQARHHGEIGQSRRCNVDRSSGEIWKQDGQKSEKNLSLGGLCSVVLTQNGAEKFWIAAKGDFQGYPVVYETNGSRYELQEPPKHRTMKIGKRVIFVKKLMFFNGVELWLTRYPAIAALVPLGNSVWGIVKKVTPGRVEEVVEATYRRSGKRRPRKKKRSKK